MRLFKSINYYLVPKFNLKFVKSDSDRIIVTPIFKIHQLVGCKAFFVPSDQLYFISKKLWNIRLTQYVIASSCIGLIFNSHHVSWLLSRLGMQWPSYIIVPSFSSFLWFCSGPYRWFSFLLWFSYLASFLARSHHVVDELCSTCLCSIC